MCTEACCCETEYKVCGGGVLQKSAWWTKMETIKSPGAWTFHHPNTTLETYPNARHHQAARSRLREAQKRYFDTKLVEARCANHNHLIFGRHLSPSHKTASHVLGIHAPRNIIVTNARFCNVASDLRQNSLFAPVIAGARLDRASAFARRSCLPSL